VYSTEDEEFMNIEGFDRFAADPEYDSDGTQPIYHNEPINLYYTRKRYDLTFMDGNTPLGKVESIPYEQKLSLYSNEISSINVPDKDGQKFVGWFLDKTGNTEANLSTATMPLNGLTVYAKYADVEFNVTLDLDGGTFDGSKDFWINYGAKVDSNELTQKAEKTGEELVGWFYADGPKAGQAYEFGPVTESTTPLVYDAAYGTYTGTVHLVARWRSPGLVYIKYDAGANGTDAPTNDKYGYAYSSSVVVDKPSKANSGFNFIGWVIDNGSLEYDEDGNVIVNDSDILYPNGSFKIDRSVVTTEGDKEYVTLVAVYERTGGANSSTATTTITYHSNDGKANTKLIAKVGDKDLRVNQSVEVLTLEEAFGEGYAREGYEFIGWNTDKAASTASVEAGQEYKIAADNEDASTSNTSDNVLYAIWTKKKHNVTYEITGTIIPDGVTAPTGATNVEYGTEVTVKENLSAEGYTFSGWTTTDATVTAGKFNMPDKDVKFTGSFTANRHNVTYEITGDVIPEGVTAPEGDTEVAYGTEVTVKDALSAAGYTFSGWTTNDATVTAGKFEMPDKNVKFTGSFTANSDVAYKVQWLTKDADGNDKTLKDEETRTDGTTGQSASATDADKVFPGYTYDAASSTDSVIVKGDGSSVIKLYFTVNRHNVTYEITGDVKPEGVTAPTGETNVAYGTEVTVKEDLSAAGYTFTGWTTNDATVVDGKFEMPDRDVAFKGEFAAKTDVTYKVQWLTKDADGNDKTLRDEETRTDGTTGQSASATDADKVFPGYTYDAASSTDSVIVKGDGSSVIKLYFTVNRHNVTYEITGDVIPEGVTAPTGETNVAYGTEVTVKDALSAAGYTFSGWTTTNATVVDGKFGMPDGDVAFTGSFTANRDVEYKVQWLTKNENGQDVPLRTEETRNNGTTGQEVSATDADKVFPGYTYDASSSTESVIVKGDGSSVIKLYFTVNRHNLTYEISGDVIPEVLTAP
ncbi:MAG: InlB B-repeat-containing protein, partial [Butyrivibrio sp.]|nr:InlB B-repeat-containing protein [Butyrivibrio sp.]